MRLSIAVLLLFPEVSSVAQRPVAIRNVTVIDGTGAAPKVGQTVLLSGNRIARIGATGAVALPAGTRILDGTGQALLPGFIDMHAHPVIGPVSIDATTTPPTMNVGPDPTGPRDALQVLLAFGITTIRNPAAKTEAAVALRDSVRLGYFPGPRIFTAGAAIDAVRAPGMVATVTSVAEVRAEVARQAAQGVDYVKLYASLPADQIRAGVEEAHRRGVRAIAHLFGTSWTDAANAGIDGIVHITPGSPLLLRPEKRPAFLARFRGTQFMLEWFDAVDTGSPEIAAMTQAMVSHHVFLDPTLVTFEAMAWGDSARITQSPDLRYASPVLADGWQKFSLSTGWTPSDYAAARGAWPKVLAFTKHLYDSGVTLTAGTDAGNPFTPPGISFHRELELLVAAGIRPLEVLRIATMNGARSLGIEGEVGSIAVGKVADLVLVRGDPSADISATRNITWVIQGGVAHRPASLLPARLRGARVRVT